MKINLLLLLLTPIVFSKEYVWEHRTGYANGNSFEARLGYTVTGSKRDANLLVAYVLPVRRMLLVTMPLDLIRFVMSRTVS